MSLHLGHLSPQDQVRCLIVSLTAIYFLFTNVYHRLHCKSLDSKGCVLFPSSQNLNQCIGCLLLQWDLKTKHFNSQWLKGTVVQILLVQGIWLVQVWLQNMDWIHLWFTWLFDLSWTCVLSRLHSTHSCCRKAIECASIFESCLLVFFGIVILSRW